MTKTKILIGLTSLICVLAVTTTTANAWFEANTAGETKGPIASFPASMTFGGGAGEIKCESIASSKATGFWEIQNAEEKIVGEEQLQTPTKLGPHEALTIQKWGACKTTIAGTKLIVEVSECRLGIEQANKSVATKQGALASFQTNCVVKIPVAKCTLTIAQSTANHNRELITLNNSGTNGVEIKLNLTGITYKGSAGCPSMSGENATLSTGTAGSEAIVTSGQKLV